MNPSLKRFSFQAMGSHCEIQLFHDSRVYAKRLAQKLGTEAHRLEKKYSRFTSDSLASIINQQAGDKYGIKIDQETKLLFDHALTCFEESDGLFDITSGQLSRIWDFKSGRVPDHKRIAKALENTGFHKLSWHRSRLHMPAGMEIDFGGIVKEYAADSLAKLARALGSNSGLINLGGDFSVIGPMPENESWPIAIADPHSTESTDSTTSVMARINLSDGGLASSGDYERFFFFEGERYSHILNPKTGWPSKGLRAVSVASHLCTVAGSMASIAMLKNETQGIQWLLESGLPHVYMKQNGEIGGLSLNARLSV
ncbi:MAG: thiamine biosynthesis lipoprotein [Glaciecola sp.]|jgi:thiamine biosynthesis lipoprotein